jgi:hypothetical protein
MISADASSFGAGASIPGMMRTLLDVGLNDPGSAYASDFAIREGA